MAILHRLTYQTNPFQALANGDMLGLIFFAIIFGLVLNMINKDQSKLLKEIISAIFTVIMKITQIIIFEICC